MYSQRFSKKLRLLGLTSLISCAGSLGAAPSAITSATTVDIYYNTENPGDLQFAYQIVAAGATAYDATGLPPGTTLNRTTGWINGSRNVPGTYVIAIRASNGAGSASVTVRLAIHPTVLGVQSSQGLFRAGQAIRFTLHYNTAVVVTGTPRLALVIGPRGAPLFTGAAYVSGSGTSDLVFQHVVAAGDNDPDGVQLLPSAPTGGVISDASGLTASPTLPVRHFVSGITITTSVASTAPPLASPSGARIARR